MKFLFLILVLSTPALAVNSPKNFSDNSRPKVEDAFATQIHAYYRSPDDLIKRFRAAQSTGIKQLREDFKWQEMEKSPGVYDFTEADFIVDTAAQYGLTLTAILVYGNPIYSLHGDLYASDIDADAYARFAGNFAKHFKNRIVRYEIWNEPNVYFRFFRAKTPELSASRYAKLLKKSYAAVKSEVPNSIVILGGLYEPQYGVDLLGHFIGLLGGQQYLDMLEKFSPGIKDSFDVIGWHPYRYPHSAPEIHNILQPSLAHSVTTVSKKWQKPVYITEMGYHTANTSLPLINGVSLNDQAIFLVRSYLLALSAGVDYFSWYQLAEGGGHIFAFENSFGIYNEDVTVPKPARESARVMLCILGKTKFSQGQIYPNIPGYDLSFISEDQTMIRVVWKQPKDKKPWSIALAADEIALNLWGEALNTEQVIPEAQPVYILKTLSVPACL